MDPLGNMASVKRKIGELEQKHRLMAQKLEKVELQKRGGARYFQGTEIPIDDAIFSIREGQVRSAKITLEFYRQTLFDLNPQEDPAQPGPEGIVVQ
jgi:hypothetical protein